MNRDIEPNSDYVLLEIAKGIQILLDTLSEAGVIKLPVKTGRSFDELDLDAIIEEFTDKLYPSEDGEDAK